MSAVAEIRLRGYRAQDLEALHALDVVCFEPPFRFSRSAMRRFAETDRARVVVAEAGRAVAGFCIAHVERGAMGRVGYVVTLDVDPAHRSRGLAAQMMAAVEEQCMSAGCVGMLLHVYVRNAGAIRFYARCGYLLSAREADFYGAGLDAEVWWKPLVWGVGDPLH